MDRLRTEPQRRYARWGALPSSSCCSSSVPGFILERGLESVFSGLLFGYGLLWAGSFWWKETPPP